MGNIHREWFGQGVLGGGKTAAIGAGRPRNGCLQLPTSTVQASSLMILMFWCSSMAMTRTVAVSVRLFVAVDVLVTLTLAVSMGVAF